MNAAKPMIRARHILVANEYEVQDLQRKLREGKDFGELARIYSLCPSSRNDGDLGFFRREQMVEPFSDVAFGLQVGEISPPVRTRFGFHLIRREE